jgi:hypothetical protein
MPPAAQTWIALHALIQESFQHQLNAMAPTAGHQGYALALPHQQNDTDDVSIKTVATQVAALAFRRP